MEHRKKTHMINVGSVKIGGGAPISIQSMTNTDTRDIESTSAQIRALQEAGCEIVRVATPDMEAATAIKEIKKNVALPLVADIHFDYRLAIEAIKHGADKIRINPGNIGGIDRIKAVVSMAKPRGIPIRIGVNSGSLEADIVKAHGGITAEGLVESALRNIRLLEGMDFSDICVSIKSSNIPTMIDAYELLSQQVDYPLHVGLTEAGTPWPGSIKSAVGIGAVLSRGIGDTIRVSLTGDPTQEARCAREILKGLRLREFGMEFTSCPTCGRTKIDLISIADEVEKRCAGINKNIRVAVMGCAVNGPGEAKDADIGIAGGDGYGVIFKKGKVFRKVEESRIISVLMEEISQLTINN
ncbi:MAG: flavodoxin-dependent (E)-4-hydroxy-3-methylbut-2-enyl-diphosphate synthase [Oscillospiraceae bacterium]|nr:flavodoxin-dependent (E)-4-hydroxy-3-methylbut-2-enyl-diphosphate synthase [Oscillospiraceae bacterium]